MNGVVVGEENYNCFVRSSRPLHVLKCGQFTSLLGRGRQRNTVEPVYNDHPRELRNCPLIIQVAALYRITKNTHWAWSNCQFNGVSYKNTSCMETVGQSTLFEAIDTLNKVANL